MQQAIPPSNQETIPSKTTTLKKINEQQEAITTSVASPSAPSQSTFHSLPQPEDPYDYEKCTIVAVIQIRPRRDTDHARSVLLSVQNGTTNVEDLPLYRLLTENDLGGPFPPALVALFEELAHQLPERKRRHEQRMTKKTTTNGNASTKPAQTSKASGKQRKTSPNHAAKPFPPVPSTAPPKNELVLNGFDWPEPEQSGG